MTIEDAVATAIRPHGTQIGTRMLPDKERLDAKKLASTYRSLSLTPKQLCDVELILSGAFSPLTGFLTRQNYQSVIETMHLGNGVFWPMPIALEVTPETAKPIQLGESLALRDGEGVLIALLQVADLWQPDLQYESKALFSENNSSNEQIASLYEIKTRVLIGGEIQGIESPRHYDFSQWRRTPTEMRRIFEELGWDKIAAFCTRYPIHQDHREFAYRAAESVGANLLLSPLVGSDSDSRYDVVTRIRCYEHALPQFPAETTLLNLIPHSPRPTNVRETLLQAILCQNYGCTHFIAEYDPSPSNPQPAIMTSADRDLIAGTVKEHLSIEMIFAEKLTYSRKQRQFLPSSRTIADDSTQHLTEPELLHRLEHDLDIPSWHSFPAVIDELRRAKPPRHKQGFTIFFTGLSGAGKSTIANALRTKLLEHGQRRITLLDGDIVRKHLSSELGFSHAHRNLNIERIGYVASEITKHGGIAICAPIAPYTETREKVRNMIGEYGGFIEVYIATPIDICEQRDRKGLYAKARAGLIPSFTGVSDPYEPPTAPDVTIDTSHNSPEDSAQQILLKLENLGYLSGAKNRA